MTTYPAAYCSTCGNWLSPQGSMKAARAAKRDHRANRRKFSGIRHRVTVYESREDWRAQRV